MPEQEPANQDEPSVVAPVTQAAASTAGPTAAPNTARATTVQYPSAPSAKKPADAPSYGRRVARSVPTEVASAPKQSRNCLLVDDSRVIRKVARRIVEGRGYVTAEAENGQEALEKCKIAMPDLIILDWDMPIMTGIEFLAELRTTPGGKRPKVVFCTTHSSVKDIHQAVDIGADEYVTKPFDEGTLVAKLEIIGAS